MNTAKPDQCKHYQCREDRTCHRPDILLDLYKDCPAWWQIVEDRERKKKEGEK